MNFNKNQVINEIKKKIPNSKFIMSKNLITLNIWFQKEVIN